MSWYPATAITSKEDNYLLSIQKIFKVQDINRQWTPYILTPHQIEWHKDDVAIQHYNAKSRVVDKSRNTSFTTSAIISNIMSVPNYPGQVIPFVRLNQERANDLITEAKKIITKMKPLIMPNGNLYPFDTSQVDLGKAGSITFPNGVEFRAFPATASASEVIRGLRIAGSAGLLDECFTGDVYIHTNKGLKCLWSLEKEKNILIKSLNIENKKIEYQPLNGILKKKTKEYNIIHISLTKEKFSIHTTENHPFYNEKFELIEAKNLKIGDNLIYTSLKSGNSLSNIQKEILYGCILGDTYIGLEKKYKKSANINFAHSLKQNDYLKHKCDIFDISTFSKEHNTFLGGKTISATSRNIKELKEIYDIFYPNNKKTITEENIKLITPISLAYWFMDDGSCSNNTFSLHTQGFSENENKIILNYLKNKYGITGKVYYRKNKNYTKGFYYLIFDRNGSAIFNKIISPYIIPSMRYKLLKESNIVYKGHIIKNNIFMKDYSGIQIEKTNYKICKILDIKKEKKRCKVYNLDVSKNHNFFVGGIGILVHNCNFMRDFENIFVALSDSTAGENEFGKSAFQMNIGTTIKGMTPYKIWRDKIGKLEESGQLRDIKIYRWPVFDPKIINYNMSFLQQPDLVPIVSWHSLEKLENRRLRDLNKFKEEYMSIAVDSEEQFYPSELILNCINTELENYKSCPQTGIYYMGIDVASVHDFFAVSIFEKINNSFEQRFLMYKRKVELPFMQEVVMNLIDMWHPLRVRIDANGIGFQMAQALTRKYGSVINPIRGSIKGMEKRQRVSVNEYLHTNHKALMTEGKVKLINDEMQIIHYSTWDYTYKAESTAEYGHGDITVANTLATLPLEYKLIKKQSRVFTNIGKDLEQISKVKTIPDNINWGWT